MSLMALESILIAFLLHFFNELVLLFHDIICLSLCTLVSYSKLPKGDFDERQDMHARKKGITITIASMQLYK